MVKILKRKKLEKCYEKDCECYIVGIYVGKKDKYSGKILEIENVNGSNEIVFNPVGSSMFYNYYDMKKIINNMEKWL